MFKFLIFDLDNTLYDYDICHNKAIEHIISCLATKYRIDKHEIRRRFNIEKDKFQSNIPNSASSHNKFIQIKKLLENLSIDLDDLDFYFNLYMKIFNDNLVLYPNVDDFLEFCFSNNIKMYILTNNTCKEQIYKLKKLNILKYFERINTSEEFNTEKPDPKLFYYILGDIGCNKNDVAVVGDSFNIDIRGANNVNIYGFLFNTNNKFKIKKNFTEFPNYKELLNFFKSYYQEIETYIGLAKYTGERFDLVQAGGGNISFKLNDIMFIKSSGCCLSDLDIHKNYVGVKYKYIKNRVSNNSDKNSREKLCDKVVNESIVFFKNFKPSIETSMHCFTKKYTLHIHPIQFNTISGRKNCENIVNGLFNDILFINYFTPGVDVALEIKEKYNDQSIIFMKNHGMIFTSDGIKDIYNLVESTMEKLEKINNHSFLPYKFVNSISKGMNSINNKNSITYLSTDHYIFNLINNSKKLLNFKTFFPDKLIYCGIDVVYLCFDSNIEDIELNIQNYINKNREFPKIFIVDNFNKDKKYLYISSGSIKKCLEIESVLKSHLICCNKNELNMDYLDDHEINYLNNWEAEKYRININ